MSQASFSRAHLYNPELNDWCVPRRLAGRGEVMGQGARGNRKAGQLSLSYFSCKFSGLYDREN